MQTKVVALFFLVAATFAFGRKCEPKMSKADFLGKIGQVPVGPMNGQTMVLNVRGTHFKDVDKKMEVLVETIQSDVYNGNITYIRDGNSGMAYAVTNNGMNCTKITDPAGPVFQLCTDTPKLTPIGSLNVGTYTLDLYNYEAPNGNSTLTLERESFTFINAVTVQTIQGYGQMVATQYGNMSTTDIPSSVFNIPSSCNKK